MIVQVKDVMHTDPVTVAPDTPVEEVLRVLDDHEETGLPVVDGDHCVGIITENDLVIPDPEGDLHLPHYISVFGGMVFIEPLSRFEGRLRKAFAAKAADMMTPDPVTVHPDATVEEAGRIMHDRKHNRLPVVDGDGRLVGVVTRVDVLEGLVAH
jgi:CBS domain-containing protein